MANEKKELIGVKTDLNEIVKHTVLAFMSKCANSVDYLSKNKDIRWEQLTHPGDDMKDIVIATGSIALHMADMMTKDPEVVEEMVEAVLHILAVSGEKMSNEEMEYVKKEMSQEDEYRSMYQ